MGVEHSSIFGEIEVKYDYINRVLNQKILSRN